jgi:ketosteroid isomerase-like protein
VTDTDAEQEVRAALAAMMEALNTADRDALAPLLATGGECTMIGSDPEEWLTGDQLLVVLDQAMQAGGNPVRGELDETFVHVRGDVAWVEARGKFIDPTGRECLLRSTGVLIKEDGAWKGVQSHVSIGVPNDQVFPRLA